MDAFEGALKKLEAVEAENSELKEKFGKLETKVGELEGARGLGKIEAKVAKPEGDLTAQREQPEITALKVKVMDQPPAALEAKATDQPQAALQVKATTDQPSAAIEVKIMDQPPAALEAKTTDQPTTVVLNSKVKGSADCDDSDKPSAAIEKSAADFDNQPSAVIEEQGPADFDHQGLSPTPLQKVCVQQELLVQSAVEPVCIADFNIYGYFEGAAADVYIASKPPEYDPGHKYTGTLECTQDLKIPVCCQAG